MVDRFKDAVLLLFSFFVWLLSRFCPRRTGRWTFGAIRGVKYLDNTRHLFEHLYGLSGFDCAWITRSDDLAQHIRSRGYKAYQFYSVRGLWHVMTSEVVFFTHRGNLRNGDLPYYAMGNGSFRVQMWHGIPLKKIGYDDKIFGSDLCETSFRFKVHRLVEKFLPYLTYVKTPDMVVALSEETRSIFEGAFRVSREKIAITGYSRNDLLFSAHPSSNSYKKIIYMPTFRGGEGEPFDPLMQFGFDLGAFEKTLKEKNCLFSIKVHPFNLPSPEMLRAIETSEFVSFLWIDDIYPSLNQYDILVTDYSSVYFDFLLLERPIIFAPFDHEVYVKNDREFYYRYEDVTPGPKIYDWDGFLNLIEEIDVFYCRYRDEARALKKRFHTYVDANSSERIIEAVLSRMKR
jgi:CDP-glycerol glycerophosphotransferase